MIVTALLIVVGVVLTYFSWSIAMGMWARLQELGIEHKQSSTTFFDSILNSTIWGLVLSRVVWMVTHRSEYVDIPWGMLPYSRSASSFDWFTTFPWRFLRLTEGVFAPVFWGILGLGSIFLIFMPIISLARRLKLEKRGVMRSFIVKSGLVMLASILYFTGLVVYSLL